MALSGEPSQPRVYIVHTMQIVDEIESWEGHPPEILQRMLHGIAKLRAEGLDIIED